MTISLMRLVSEYTSGWRKQSFSFIPKANNSVWSGQLKYQLLDLESNMFAIIIHPPCFHICKQSVTLFLWSTIFLVRKGALFTLIDFCMITYRRFHSSITADQKWLRERSHESYAKNYSMVFPHDEPLASRNMRCDPFHKVKHLYQMSLLSSNTELSDLTFFLWYRVGIKCIIGQVLRQAGLILAIFQVLF